MSSLKLFRRFHWSNFLLIGFALMVGTVALFAELFRTPTQLPSDIVQLVQNPIPLNDLAQLKQVTFTNRHGTYSFENTDEKGSLAGPWKMTEPQTMKARPEFIARIIEVLSNLQVRNVYRLEPINLSSFSLDNPLVSLDMAPLHGPRVELKFGLVNPIDNTTYFTQNGQNWIYQSTVLNPPLDNIMPAELIDGKVLAFNTDQLTRVEWHFPNEGLSWSMLKDNNEWKDEEGQALKRAEAILTDLLQVKSSMVLDKLTDNQRAELLTLYQKPAAQLVLKSQGKIDSMFVSPLVDRLADLKFEKGMSFLIYQSTEQAPVVVPREFYSLFQKKPKDLK